MISCVFGVVRAICFGLSASQLDYLMNKLNKVPIQKITNEHLNVLTNLMETALITADYEEVIEFY